SWAAFEGVLLPAAVFTSELIPLQIEELHRTLLTTDSKVTVDFEPPPERIAAKIEVKNSVVARWGDDEPDAENTLENPTFSTELPGGYQRFEAQLGRDPQ